MKVEATNRRAIRIVSQCASAEEFLAVFHPYLERDALFIATGSPEEAGARLRFVMTLASGEPMMKGGAVVLETHRDRSNFYGLRGMKVRFDDLDEGSKRTLAKLENGPPSRRAASQPGIAGARRAAEVLECLIFDEPGSEAAEPMAGARAMMDSMASEPEPPPIGQDDDVTAVAPMPQRPGEPITQRDLSPADPAAVAAMVTAASAARPGPAHRFIVPAPKSEPAVAIGTADRPGDLLATDRSLPPLEAEVVAASEPARVPVSAPAERPRTRDGNGAGVAASTPLAPASAPSAPAVVVDVVPARPRGKGGPTGERPAIPPSPIPAPFGPVAQKPPDGGLGGSVFELGPVLEPGADRGSDPALAQLPTMRLNTAPPQMHPDVPAMSRAVHDAIGMPTPTEIVSPLALRNRTSKPPLPPERTELVRVGQLRTAAVSATIGALLGLGAGYLLWGLAQEGRGGHVAPIDATVPGGAQPPTPAPAPVFSPDAGPAAAAATDAAPTPPTPDDLKVQRALRVVSTPPGAEVLIDKKRAGVTPFELPLEGKKAMTVTLRKAGFKPWTKLLAGDELDTTFEVVMRRDGPVRRR
ncbi:MAG TPA: PEGA domain-containing protein [Kofleriaceae bacterium]|nr:PEGA domain-containing protein [Kofleriaceae bacterium]